MDPEPSGRWVLNAAMADVSEGMKTSTYVA
jgi:hypothetical protein